MLLLVTCSYKHLCIAISFSCSYNDTMIISGRGRQLSQVGYNCLKRKLFYGKKLESYVAPLNSGIAHSSTLFTAYDDNHDRWYIMILFKSILGYKNTNYWWLHGYHKSNHVMFVHIVIFLWHHILVSCRKLCQTMIANIIIKIIIFSYRI